MNFWIFPTDAEGWALVKAHNVYAFAREVDRNKIKAGDMAIFYLVRSNPPVFVGVYEVIGKWEESKEPFWAEEKAEGKVIWPWRFQLSPLRLGAVDARRLSKQLSFVESKDAWSAYFMGSLANFGRPISESDYQLIHQELANPPITYQVRTVAKRVGPPGPAFPRRRKGSVVGCWHKG